MFKNLFKMKTDFQIKCTVSQIKSENHNLIFIPVSNRDTMKNLNHIKFSVTEWINADLKESRKHASFTVIPYVRD